MSSIIPVPRFGLERRCPRRSRVAVAAFFIAVRGDGDLGGAASLGKIPKSGPLKVRPLVGPTTKTTYTDEIMPAPPNASLSIASPSPEEHFTQCVSRQTAAKPLSSSHKNPRGRTPKIPPCCGAAKRCRTTKIFGREVPPTRPKVAMHSSPRQTPPLAQAQPFSSAFSLKVLL
jgi:hypothetical protein